MTFGPSKLRGISLALGIAVFAVASIEAPAVSAWDDDAKSEKSTKKKTKSYGASSAPVVVTHKNSKVTVKGDELDSKKRSWSVESKTVHQNALRQVQDSLRKVEERLARTEKPSEKVALQVARDGLMTALASLKQQARLEDEVQELQAVTDVTVVDALKDIELKELDLNHLRVDVIDELNDVRSDLADELGDVEMELGLDGEVRALRINSLKDANAILDELESEQLKALRLVQEELDRARMNLEKKLAKQKAKEKTEEQKCNAQKSADHQ